MAAIISRLGAMISGSGKARQTRRLVLRDQLRNIPELHRNSRLMQLPLDILLLIADYLPDEAKGALALTCKIFWWRWNSTFRNKATWALVLGLLERDIQGVFFCYECGRLETIKRQMWSRYHRHLRSPKPHPSLDANNTLRGLISLKVWPNHIRLNFYYAHLVMNGHRYGARHGLPLETLRVHQKKFVFLPYWPYVDNPLLVTNMSWQPRIIDGELFLRATVAVSERIPIPSQGIDDLKDGLRYIDMAYNGQTSDDKLSYYEEDCFTHVGVYDYESPAAGEFGLGVKRSSFKMVMRIYFNLGRCERPDDWKWSRHVPGPNFNCNRDVTPPDAHSNPMLKWKRATGDHVGPKPKGLEGWMDGIGLLRDDPE